MTSPASAAIDTIKTIIEGLTPPDRTSVVYRSYGGQGEPNDASADRMFWFRTPNRGRPNSERGGAMTEFFWDVSLCLRLSAAPHSREKLVKACLNEGALIHRAIDKYPSSFGSGVNHVECGEIGEETDKEDRVLIFPLTIETEETD